MACPESTDDGMLLTETQSLNIDGAVIESPLKPPARISGGKEGKKINLETNYFPIRAAKDDVQVAFYEVAFRSVGSDPIMSRKQKMEIFELMKAMHPKLFDSHPVAFDSDKRAYSVGVIPDVANSQELSATYEVCRVKENCNEKWRITLTVKRKLHLRELLDALCFMPDQHKKLPQSIMQSLEVMFRHYRSLKYELVGRRHFFSMGGEFGASFPIGTNKQGIVGFFSSLRPASLRDGSLLLNIDVAHSAFYTEQSLLDFVHGVIGLRESDLHRTMDPHRRERLMREIKDLKVKVVHCSVQICRIICVTELSANKQTFPHKDKKTGITSSITVSDYFKHMYGRRLLYPNFNCVQVAPAEKNIFLPMELCRVTSGQKVKKKLGDQEIAQLMHTSAVAPAERKRQICEIYAQNNFPEDPMLQNLRFIIDKNPLSIPGRVLPSPKLFMDHMVQPHCGVWDARNVKFFRSAVIRSWLVFNYSVEGVNVPQIKQFLQHLMNHGQKHGMEFSDPIAILDMPRAHIEEQFAHVKGKYDNLQLILVVLGKSDELYGKVKRAGDIDVGVLTQCVEASTVRLCKIPVITNVILKINAKMGGINNIIANPSTPPIFYNPVMIMGADVSHPPGGDSSSSSVAAVVASLDRHASMYAVEVMPQDHRLEIIKDLSKMMRNLLLSYKKIRGEYPHKIVMYRDGVSESQFTTVLLCEVKAMRNACAELSPSYKPGITFLIVQKRHHTRFFCQEAEGVGKSKNIPPGTVVDSGITHPNERDFYLCSHQGSLGTSRPTHYHVLWDDNNMTMDDLEVLTYSMCHLYSRCTRAVSQPTPAYYAHLAAFRARVHINEFLNQCDCPEHVTSEEIMMAAKVDLSNPMARRLYYV